MVVVVLTSAQQIVQLQNRKQDILNQIESLNANNYDLPNSSATNNINRIEKIKAWYDELELIDGRLNALTGGWSVETVADVI